MFKPLFHLVVGGFARDDDVMDVRFAKTSGGDAQELAALHQFFQRARADGAHSAPQATDGLIGQCAQRAPIGGAALDAFRDRLYALRPLLRLAVTGTPFPRSPGAPARV